LEDLRHPQSNPTVLFEDNQSCIALTKNPVHHTRSKHIDIQYHWIREKVENGDITLTYVPTAQQIAASSPRVSKEPGSLHWQPLFSNFKPFSPILNGRGGTLFFNSTLLEPFHCWSLLPLDQPHSTSTPFTLFGIYSPLEQHLVGFINTFNNLVSLFLSYGYTLCFGFLLAFWCNNIRLVFWHIHFWFFWSSCKCGGSVGIHGISTLAILHFWTTQNPNFGIEYLDVALDSDARLGING
jgi:hypothetical protein